MLETQFNTFIMDAVLPRSMKEDYAKRFGRDEVSAAYLHQQAVDMLPDIDYTVKLNDKQLELVRWADIIGSLSQVRQQQGTPWRRAESVGLRRGVGD